MALPYEIQTLIQLGLENVRETEYHSLNLEIRQAIYHAFCPQAGHLAHYFDPPAAVVPTIWPSGYFHFAWLVILTAQTGLPLVERYCFEGALEQAHWSNLTRLPGQVLTTAKQMIRGELTPGEAYDLLNGDYYFGLSGVNMAFPYPIACAAMAPYEALSMLLNGTTRYDVAATAAEAAAAIDANGSGVWAKNFFPLSAIQPEFYSTYHLDAAAVLACQTGYPSIFQPPIPIRYDLDQRRVFRENWLTETVPQACEMAER